MAGSPSSQSWTEDIERSRVLKTAFRAVLTSGVLIAIYYLAPIPRQRYSTPLPHVIVALSLFVIVLIIEVRQILKSDEPILRAAVAMAVILPFFIVIWAWLYLVMSQSSIQAFGTHMTRTSALYFAVTVLSTVGFGDIAAKTDSARLVVTVQMLSDLAVIAVVVRLIVGAVDVSKKRKTGQTTLGDQAD